VASWRVLAAGRILFEANAPSVSSVSQDEQQETLEGFRNEVGLLSLGCPQCRAGALHGSRPGWLAVFV
jgi:hypothetical protein